MYFHRNINRNRDHKILGGNKWVLWNQRWTPLQVYLLKLFCFYISKAPCLQSCFKPPNSLIARSNRDWLLQTLSVGICCGYWLISGLSTYHIIEAIIMIYRVGYRFELSKISQYSLSKNKVIMGLVLVVTYPSKWTRRVELSIILCLWISQQLFWLWIPRSYMVHWVKL